MRFGIYTLDDFDVKGKTVLCRVDMNQPVDRASDSLKSIQRITACAPTLKELSDRYPPRIVSRILGEFTICHFWGEDIRLQLRRK